MKILIADDHQVVREGLKQILKNMDKSGKRKYLNIVMTKSHDFWSLRYLNVSLK